MRQTSPSIALHPFESDDALVEVVARRWLSALQSQSIRTLALSGGRVATSLFRAIVRETKGQPGPWTSVHCFWADERCVPPDHEASNYRLAKNELLDPLGWRTDRIHRLRGEIDPTEAARQAEMELTSVIGDDGRLDLVLLGMGEDGHIASLFPGQLDAEGEGDRCYRAVRGPKPPLERITLSLEPLKAAAQVWVIVSGPGKQLALNHALQGQLDLPMGRLLSERTSTQVFSSVQVTDN
jgi:6-phosphogluconolactonase